MYASRRGSDGKRSYCYRTWKPIVFTVHTHTRTQRIKVMVQPSTACLYLYAFIIYIFFYYYYYVRLKFVVFFQNLVMFLTPTSRSLQRPVDPRLCARAGRRSFHRTHCCPVIGFIIILLWSPRTHHDAQTNYTGFFRRHFTTIAVLQL